MDKLKQQIQQKLVANILVDKCTHCERLIFRDAWCTQERVIRFTTPFFRELFTYKVSDTGKWKTGDCVMYECHNGGDSLTINCVLSTSSVGYADVIVKNTLLKAVESDRDPSSSDVILNQWYLASEGGDINRLFMAFDELINRQIPLWEQNLKEKMDESKEELVLTEGATEYVTHRKYERSPKARAACIAAHGTACSVCGIDFAKAYGPEFAGKIEVHHIVPLSEIGEEYVVDPVKDLVPVCPNCHTALHSKKDGVYTIEELKAIRARQK